LPQALGFSLQQTPSWSRGFVLRMPVVTEGVLSGLWNLLWTNTKSQGTAVAPFWVAMENRW